MSNTIRITKDNEVKLPIYIKKGKDRYAAIMGRVEGSQNHFNEVQVAYDGMVATYSHMDAAGAVKEIMGGEEVTREEFMAAFDQATARILKAVQP